MWGREGKAIFAYGIPAKMWPRYHDEFHHVFTSMFYFIYSFFWGDGFQLVPLEIATKMSKMPHFRQRLFRWKEKEKVPKTEWPELVGKVIGFQNSVF